MARLLVPAFGLRRRPGVVAHVLCAVLALGLAACGDDGASTGPEPPDEQNAAPSPVPADGLEFTTPGAIEVPAGEEFVIALDENPTTGHVWELDQAAADAAIVSLLGDEYEQQPGTEDRVGAGGTHRFTFHADGPGSTTLRFDEVAPDGSVTQMAEFDLTIR